jgi:uncharacterized protein (DUF885 family)
MKSVLRAAASLALLLGLVLPLAAQTGQGKPAAPQKAPKKEQKKEQPKRPPPPTLADRYVSSWLQLFPTEAAARGDYSQIANLEDLPPKRILAWLKYNQTITKEIGKRLASPELSGDERLDLLVLRDQARLEILTYDTLRRHQNDPLYWTAILSQATVFQLVREDRPAAERLEGAARRAEKMTILASHLMANLAAGDPDRMAPEHVTSAKDLLPPLAEFYRSGFAQAASQLPAGPKRQKMATRLEHAGKSAAATIDALVPFFERLEENARGNPRLLLDYPALFRATTGLSESPAAVAARATKALETKRQEAAEHCRAIWPQFFAGVAQPEDQKELLRICFDRVEQDGAKNIEEFIADYQQLTDKALAFVRQKGFITLPPKLKIRVDRSPAYFGAAAVGGIYPPGPYSPDAPSLLFVPAPPPETPPEQLAAFFKDFNHHFNVMITPHETVPGHAAQMTLAAHQPSKVRALFYHGPYVEGWGSFSERVMLDQGWGDGLARVAHLKKQLENVARVVIDIQVHTEGWTEEQALAFVREEALQKEQFAGNMWRRTLQSPTQITTYWIGYQQIQELYDEARRRRGDKFVLKEFLDGMMKLGPVALQHYRKVIFPPPPAPPAPPAAAPPKS